MTTSAGDRLPVRLRGLGEQWGESTIPVGWVVAAGVALLGVLVVAWLWTWWRERHLRPRPWWVFHCTARHMGLTWRERWLLMCIARHERLPSPLTLMLSRRTLGYHTKHYLEGRSTRRRVLVMRRVVAIRQALFDPPEPPPGVAGSA